MRRLIFLGLCFASLLGGGVLWGAVPESKQVLTPPSKQQLIPSQNQELTSAQKRDFRSSVCSIYVSAQLSAYETLGSWQGTGFVCDKARGIICTNHHIVGYGGGVASYDVEFMDGQKLEARLLYADPWHDFAFLEVVTPSLIPEGVRELSTFASPHLGEVTFIAGNNEGQSFSFQQGRVSELYASWGFMPEPSFGCLVNTVGGSSGSPVVNTNLEVLGIHFSGFGDGRCLEIRGRPLKSALEALRRGQRPTRKHFGGMLKLASLEKHLEILKFPKEVARTYLKEFPQASFRVLEVDGVLPGSPADGVLEVGDVVMSVSGHPVGPDLDLLEQLLDTSPKDSVVLGLYRKGDFIERELPLYDLNDFVVKRLVMFGGMTFFEADDLMRWQYGVKPRQIMACNIVPGSAFSPLVQEKNQMFLVEQEDITSLLKSINQWSTQQKFSFCFSWLTPVNSGQDGIYFNSHARQIKQISYKASQNQPPEFLEWFFEARTWREAPLTCILKTKG